MEAVDGGVLGSGTSLTFAGTGGTLQVDDTTMPTAVISGFAPGDTLAFIGLGQILTPDVSVTGVTLLPNNALQLTTQDIFFDTSTYYLQLDPAAEFQRRAVRRRDRPRRARLPRERGDFPVRSKRPGRQRRHHLRLQTV